MSADVFTLEPLQPFGARVLGLDLSAMPPAETVLRALEREVASRGFLVFPEQQLSSADGRRATLSRVSRLFGSGVLAARHTVHKRAVDDDVLRLSNREE